MAKQNRVVRSWDRVRGTPGVLILRCESTKFKLPHYAWIDHMRFVRGKNQTSNRGSMGAGRHICGHCLEASKGSPVEEALS